MPFPYGKDECIGGRKYHLFVEVNLDEANRNRTTVPISFKARRIVVDGDSGYLIAYPCDDTLPSVVVEMRDEEMARGIIEELQEYIRCNPSPEQVQYERDQASLRNED
jgi:hypothetical protein